MRMFKALALAGLAIVAAASTSAAEVLLTLHDGQVTIIAKDATVRQILTEWARVGRTRIVNLERIPGGPMTIELRNVPEQEALDVLLRTLSGYLAAPRATPVADASLFDPIVVLPTSAAPRPAAAPAPAPFAPPPAVQRQAPPIPGPPTDDDSDDERPSPNVVVPPPQRGVFTPFPAPQVVNPQPPGVAGPSRGVMPSPGAFAPANQPPQVGAPAAVQPTPSSPAPAALPGAQPRPGMIAAPPQPAPGQPGFVLPQPVPQRNPNDD